MCGTSGCGLSSGRGDQTWFPNWNPDPIQPRNPFEDGLDKLLDAVGLLMKQRHAKYGAGNIAKRGLPGILTRLDDKIARLDNSTDDFADESYRDAWMDVVGYGLIALMWLDGDWPGSPKKLANGESS